MKTKIHWPVTILNVLLYCFIIVHYTHSVDLTFLDPISNQVPAEQFKQIINIYIGMIAAYISFLFVLSNVRTSYPTLLYQYMTKYDRLYDNLMNIVFAVIFTYICTNWYTYEYMYILVTVNAVAIMLITLYVISKFIVMSVYQGKYKSYVDEIIRYEMKQIDNKERINYKYSSRIDDIYSKCEQITSLYLYRGREHHISYSVKASKGFLCSAKAMYRGISTVYNILRYYLKWRKITIAISVNNGYMTNKGESIIIAYKDSGKIWLIDKLLLQISRKMQHSSNLASRNENTIDQSYDDATRGILSSVSNLIDAGNSYDGVSKLVSLAEAIEIYDK